MTAGCGGLSAEERLKLSGRIAHAESRLDTYCAYGDGTPTRHVDVLIDAYRDHPDFEEGGVSMKERLRDRASRLDDCAPLEAKRIDRELAP